MRQGILIFWGLIIALWLNVGVAKATDTTRVQINLDIKHLTDTISTFDREKYVVLHATLQERDWENEDQRRDYVFGELDAWLGRENGGLNWWATQFKEDPNRPGYVDTTDVASRGATSRSRWKNNPNNKYDYKSDVMIGGLPHGVWPDQKANWHWANGEAVGEYMAHFIKNFYRPMGDNDPANGHRPPRFLEVINEPAYVLHDDPNVPENEKVDLVDIFRFHRDVARSFKKRNSTTKIGGYTVAFPEYDENDFQRWNERMKMFVDTAGADMDFYSLHFYDFNRHWQTDYQSHIHFKGSRLEATLDMIEQYDMLKFGQRKPLVISEYGGRDLLLEQGNYKPERDWQTLKAINAMLLQFLDRPDVIAKTVPFIMTKAPWSTKPHAWRLMRQNREPEEYVVNDYSTDYVFTELVKFYELWSKVNGTRVDAWSDTPDVRTDAYVDGNRAYVIVTNYSFDSHEVKLDLLGTGRLVQEINIKHLYGENDIPTLAINTLNELESFMLKPEATAIIEYVFDENLTIDESVVDKKYYADTYLKPIVANQSIEFKIDGVEINAYTNGQLRVGFGRAHEKSKWPVVLMNGQRLTLPSDFCGESQEGRSGFFGLLEIPVPHDVLQQNNTVQVTFPDDGGHVSTVILRTFDYSRKVSRSDSVRSVAVYPNQLELGIGQQRILTALITPENAADKRVQWISSNPSIVSVDQSGVIQGVAVGTAEIELLTKDGGHKAICAVTVKANRVAVEVDSLWLVPQNLEMITGETAQLEVHVLPIDVDNSNVSWSSSNPSVVSVTAMGEVKALTEGVATITATAENGKNASCQITAKVKVPGYINFDDKNKYLSTTYTVGGTLEVTADFAATTGTVVSSDGVKFWLREIKPGWAVARDYVAYDKSAAGKTSGTAKATISLDGVIPTDELDEGNFYFLWISFLQDDGTSITNKQSVFPLKIVRATAVEQVEASALRIYPNPSAGKVYFDAAQPFSQVRVFDLTGSCVLQVKPEANSFEVGMLANGVYWVEFSSDHRREVRKLIIQH